MYKYTLPALCAMFASIFVLTGCSGMVAAKPAGTTSSTTSTSNPPPSSPPPSSPAPNSASMFSNLQTDPSWTGYALLPPGYAICSTCVPTGPDMTWSSTQNVATPSMSGNAMALSIGGSTDFADGLWNNHLIGDFSSQGLPDKKKTFVTTLHNFTYDVYFFVQDVEVSQALEFDINQFTDGKSYIWGHECRIAGGHEWDTWNNGAKKWVPSGIPCNPLSNQWNHLVIQVQRTSDNQLLFQSITLNGQTANINRTDTPTDTTWFGVTINYQQDGNKNQQPYTVYLDNLNFSYN